MTQSFVTPAPRDDAHRIVLVEDDAGDTVLFEVALTEADPELRIVVVPDVANLEPLLRGGEVDCVVLDLGLPGLSGFEALDRIAGIAPNLAIVVFTGWGARHVGVEAVARGAQDYLVKGEAQGLTIARSVRFAIERKRNQRAADALAAAHLRHAEQHRLERALLGVPAIRRGDLAWASRYIAARAGVVSGDFFDAVEMADGTVRIVVGDVAGHGTDEAALGVSLRAGWRSLVLARLDPVDVLPALDELLDAERSDGDEFATLCDLVIAADLSQVVVRSAGHPPPVLAGVGPLVDVHRRAPLGVGLGVGAAPALGTAYPLPIGWSMAVYTDGLFEVRDRAGSILGVDEVAPAVEAALVAGAIDPDHLVRSFAERTDEGWRDDVALVVVGHRRDAPVP